ncbi:MAG: DUF222 domain-containing protein, partial [Actinobacteria bacterium]|nr:DUF222 domain-containing protein [Actinomycetota bacterium]
MFGDDVAAVVAGMRRSVAALEPGCLTGEQAARLLDLFAEAERLAVAGRTLVARRVEETNLWRREGTRSAAEYVTARTGTSVGSAQGSLDTARRLEDMPASAAGAPMATEEELLAAARTGSVARLRERCRQARAAGEPDEVARHRAVHRSRYLRHWTDSDGAFRMDVRTTVDAGAVVLAALEPHRNRCFQAARAAGGRESAQAYGADALVALARACSHGGDGPSGPRAMVHVRVDHTALVRGRTEAGETC